MADGEKIVPAEKYGIQSSRWASSPTTMSPVIWRGPMLHSVIQQFFHDVRWGELDYLVVDMPPGTGDVALSLSQTVPVSGAIVVTTPQEVSLADSRRAVRMYQKLNMPVLGIDREHELLRLPDCEHESDIFGRGGGEQTAEAMDVPFLGQHSDLRAHPPGRRRGAAARRSEPDSPAARASSAAEQPAAQVSIASYRKPLILVKAGK